MIKVDQYQITNAITPLIQAANTLISNSKSSVFRYKNVEITSAYRKKNELNFSIDLITRM